MALSPYMEQRLALKNGSRAPIAPKKKQPLAKKSAGRKVDDKEYKKIVKEMLAESNWCELNTPVCTVTAQGLHHKKRRGSNYLNRKYLLRSCNACNEYVEANPKYALEKGLSVSVHKI